MTKNQSATPKKKSFSKTEFADLDLSVLKQPGDEGGTPDFHKKNPVPLSFSHIGPYGRYKSALLEKPLDDYTEEALNEMLPKDFREKGYRVDDKTIKFASTDRVISVDGEKQVVTLTNVTFGTKPKSLYEDNMEIIEAALKAKAPKVVKNTSKQERALFFCIGDFQVGQADGSGAEGMVKRVLQMAAIVEERVRQQKMLKTPITQIVMPTLGDLVEGVVAFYANQTFTVQLDRREQVKVARRLVLKLIMRLAELGIPMLIAVVPGNHGENRGLGGAFTTNNDNDDVALMEQIQEVLASHDDKFAHVRFIFPEPERLSITFEVLGWSVGIVHGHQVGSPRNMGAAIRNFLNGQSRAKQAIGNVDYFFMGHYHHYYCERISEQTTAIMNGAMCDASDHFTQRFGMTSPPCFVTGILTRDGDEGFIPHYLK